MNEVRVSQSLIDFENFLSQHGIIFDGLDEVKVVKKRKLNNGETKTDIERIKVQRKVTSIPYAQKKKVINTMCITIEDIKRATIQENSWKIFDIIFRKVLIYGRAVVQNHFTKNGDSMYLITIDDGTATILGTYKALDTKETAKHKGILTREENQLKRRKETGFNMYGKFYAASSEESQFIHTNVNNLQLMIKKNLTQLHKKLQQGPLQKKVLVHAKPYEFHDQIRLFIIDLWEECDHIELAWLSNLNKLYRNQYLIES